MDSVETAEGQAHPCIRIGPTTGALISELASRVAELARAVHDLERLVLVHAAEPSRGGPEARAERDEPADRGTAVGRDAGGLGDVGDMGDMGEEAEFSLFIEASNLTRREAQVLRYLLDGHSNRRISRSLRISESTVKNHLHAIFVKLDTRDRTQVVAKAYRFMADHTAQPARARHPPDGPRNKECGRPGIEER